MSAFVRGCVTSRSTAKMLFEEAVTLSRRPIVLVLLVILALAGGIAVLVWAPLDRALATTFSALAATAAWATLQSERRP